MQHANDHFCGILHAGSVILGRSMELRTPVKNLLLLLHFNSVYTHIWNLNYKKKYIDFRNFNHP